MQVKSDTMLKDFCSYYENVKLDDAFKQAPADPTLDLHMQLYELHPYSPNVVKKNEFDILYSF